MKDQAVAICRVSTPEQRLNNSLNRQEESVQNAAALLNVEIVKWWSGDVSSKVGRNVKRKDLNEAFNFCKSNRRVKYLIVDEVDRFMRSTAEMFFWIIKLQEIGIKVYFASNPELNGDDAKARLLLSLDGFKSEGSNEERQHKSVSGHEKAIREGRYTFPPKPGYTKGTIPGVHIPHPVTHKPLQTAFREVLSGLYTPLEARKRLNESSFSKVHAAWDIDKFRKYAIDPYYAGILVKDKQVKARNSQGLHEAMLSLEEHEELVRMLSGTLKPRGPRKQYNPEFPMNKIMVCEDCGSEIKFTGSKKSNGYNRKTTTHYWKYECRGCHRSYHRVDVHSKITKRISEVKYAGKQETEFIEAMEIVWRQKQQDKIYAAKALEKQLAELSDTKSSLVIEMAKADLELKADIKQEIEKTKREMDKLKGEIKQSSELDADLMQFVEFGLNYTDDLMEDWWDLGHEDRVQCQQLIFPGGISFNSDKKVGTPQISALYSLTSNKKDLWNDQKSLMVELEGIAPSSASLSWLGFYRHRLFTILRNMAGK